MRRAALLLAIALALVASPVDAKRHRAAVATDEISAPATVPFGSTFTPTYTYAEPLGPTESLWVRGDCSGLWVQWTQAGGSLTVGATPSWSGGPARCVVELIAWDSYSDAPARIAASAPFEVEAAP